MQAGCNRPPSLRRAAVIDLPVGSRHSTRWRPNLWPGGPGCTEERSVEDVKRTYREGEEKTKEAWRGVGGTDAEDEIGNAGDDIRKGLGNAGDELRRDAPRFLPQRPRHGLLGRCKTCLWVRSVDRDPRI